MDARSFLGIEPLDIALRWRLEVTEEVSTPGKFLYGGCALAAALVALETCRGDRPLGDRPVPVFRRDRDHARPGRDTGGFRKRGYAGQGGRSGRWGEILTVNAALGQGQLQMEGTWVERPEVAAPLSYPERRLPAMFGNSVLNRVEVRTASGRMMDASTYAWKRFVLILGTRARPSRTVGRELAMIGDYVSGGVSEPLGLRTMGRNSTTPSGSLASSRPNGSCAT